MLLIDVNKMGQEKDKECNPCKKRKQELFEKKLIILLNSYCKENDSNTPDYILAKYLIGCLTVYNKAVTDRSKWHRNNFTSTSNLSINDKYSSKIITKDND